MAMALTALLWDLMVLRLVLGTTFFSGQYRGTVIFSKSINKLFKCGTLKVSKTQSW
jgi:hypothetical protein